MTTTFETAKVGDKVWCMKSGWGKISRIDDRNYPIAVSFPNDEFKTYTLGGFYDNDDITQSLFWDEIVIEAPPKPLPDLQVDTKVYVWSNADGLKLKRHFSHFKNGNCHTFSGGLSSWTGESTTSWDNWELVE